MQEASILLGNLLSDVGIKEEVRSKMKEVDQHGELVSFAYLLESETGLRENEFAALKSSNTKKRSKNLFKEALSSEFSKNQLYYQTIKNEISKNYDLEKSRTSLEIANELSTLLVSQELQIFYPYDPEYANDDLTVREFYVSYDPLNNAQTNEGFKFVDGSSSFTTTTLDNDFLDTNPVYVIVPIDPCDIAGRPCSFIDGIPSSYDASTGDYNIEGNLPWTTKDGELPDTLNAVPTLLTYNVNHNLIPETDIVSSYIPKIKVKGTSWMGFGGTHQKLRFFRGSADGEITQNIDGTITAKGNEYTVIDVRIRRADVRDEKWIDVNSEFDSDWNMSENTQSLAVFSVHHLRGTASAELGAKSGFKLENTANGIKIVPSTEASGSIKITVSLGSAKFRANVESSRRQVLSTIIGATQNGTVLDNGVRYNVKKVGIADYYFKHWYTDLTE